MDTPARDADDPNFVELVKSIEEERPSSNARLRIEKGEAQVEVSVPSSHASQLLDSAVTVLVVVGAVAAPMVTLKAVPADLPHWATVTLIAVQFLVLTLVGVRPFFSKAGLIAA